MRPLHLLLLGATFAPLTPALAQNIRATGKINEFYAAACANCHGQKLEGGRTPAGHTVPSLLDDEWLHGGDDDSIAKSIKIGYPEKEMPGWATGMTDKEIRAMVIYIREQQFAFRRGDTKIDKRPEDLVAKSKLHNFQVHPWVGDLAEPYGLAFLPGGKAIVTEKKGNVFLIENGKRAEKPLAGVPVPDIAQQAGMYDVVPHPNYAQNGWLYFAYSDLKENAKAEKVSLTKIIRGKVKDGALVEQQTIYEASVDHYIKAGGVHFGGRIVFDGKGHLYFSIGERGGKIVAQDLALPIGKVHRLHDDGRLPADNPFVKDPKALKSIWSYGHRNPQGLALNPATGDLYDLEHGPRGGDEVNLVLPGRNYGWPVISWGMDYPGTPIGEGLTAKEGMEQPVKYWVPSIAPCGANFYTGDKFPKWKNNLFVASLVGEQLVRLELRGNKLVAEEMLFRDLGRIRHVIGGPDGALYLLLPTRISRLTPAK